MSYLIGSVILGVGATGAVDLWSIFRARLFGIAKPNYGFVGRWIAYLAKGRFRHQAIAATPEIRNEHAVGWIAHYLIGTIFAALLLLLCGIEWLQHPSLAPAMAVGFGTVLAPFLILQPGMGAGIAASRSPRPTAARLQSLILHGVFGFGLYTTARAMGSIANVLLLF